MSNSSEIALVTGATGLVGVNVVNALVKRGRSVRALVRSVERARELLPSKCELVVGDVTDSKSVLSAIRGCGTIHHCAALPEQWLKNPKTFDDVNFRGTEIMVGAAKQCGIKHFIFTSTADVFDFQSDVTFDESAPISNRGGSPYIQSKLLADRYVWSAIKSGFPATIIHPVAVYGPGVRNSAVLNSLFVKLKSNKVPFIMEGELAVVFAPDVGEAHVLAEEKRKIGERYILSEFWISVPDLAREICSQLGVKQPRVAPDWMATAMAEVSEGWAKISKQQPLVARGQVAAMRAHRRPLASKARADLGWNPVNIRDGIRQTITYLFA